MTRQEKRNRNKQRAKKNQGRLIIVVVLALIWFISLAFLSTLSVAKAQDDVATQESTYRQRQSDLKKLKAKKAKLKSSTGTTDLVAKENDLTNQYSDLVKQIYGGVKSQQDFSNQKANIKKLFGANGYSQLENQVLVGTKSVLASANNNVSVSFYGFDNNSQTIHVVVVTEYSLGTPAGYTGTTYIDANYSLAKDKAISSSITSAVHSPQDTNSNDSSSQ